VSPEEAAQLAHEAIKTQEHNLLDSTEKHLSVGMKCALQEIERSAALGRFRCYVDERLIREALDYVPDLLECRFELSRLILWSCGRELRKMKFNVDRIPRPNGDDLRIETLVVSWKPKGPRSWWKQIWKKETTP
jgi:hypothetical protein